MTFFVQFVRIFLLVAVCCSAAFANMYSNRLSSAGQPGPSNVSVVWPVPETGREDLHVRAHRLLMTSPTEHGENAFRQGEPFGLPATSALRGDMSAMWNDVQSRIAADERILVACRKDETACSQAARRFLSIVELGRKQVGRARLGWINRVVNLSIRPASDLAQYGYSDYWASPLQTLSRRAGDCEDYAIVKYAVLRQLGVSANDLRLVVVRDKTRRADHAVVAVRNEQRWLILDNRTMALLDAENARHYQPLFSLDQRTGRAIATATASQITDR
jgi:predicted transglutaminase-like cysteine proteinase